MSGPSLRQPAVAGAEGPGRGGGQPRARLRCTTRLLADEVPELADHLGPGGFAWLQDGAGFTTSGVAARVPVATGPGRLDALTASVECLLGEIEVDDALELPGTGPLVVGALGFADDALAELVVPSVVVGTTQDGRSWRTDITPEGAERANGDGHADRRPATAAASSVAASSVAASSVGGHRITRYEVDVGDGHARWEQGVEAVLALIRAGRLEKVVLARHVDLLADADFDLRRLVAALARSHPSSYTYAASGFVGSSPELLVRRRGDLVVSRPMAGTVERGDTVDADRRRIEAMASSPKESREHRFVVEGVLESLTPVCTEVSASSRPEIAHLATVAHLSTTVAGRLRAPAASALGVAGLLHPTPAVAGTPTAEALAAIAELEGFDRGPYAGPVGWVDSRGDGDWAVGLRCALVNGKQARLFAGAGIVAGSSVEGEWAETQAKLEPMLRALVRP